MNGNPATFPQREQAGIHRVLTPSAAGANRLDFSDAELVNHGAGTGDGLLGDYQHDAGHGVGAGQAAQGVGNQRRAVHVGEGFVGSAHAGTTAGGDYHHAEAVVVIVVGKGG